MSDQDKYLIHPGFESPMFIVCWTKEEIGGALTGFGFFFVILHLFVPAMISIALVLYWAPKLRADVKKRGGLFHLMHSLGFWKGRKSIEGKAGNRYFPASEQTNFDG